MWYVYFLRCADNSLYAGITTSLERRLAEHNHCNKKAAKYTRVRRPVTLAYAEPQANRQQASRREYQLKQLSKYNKEQLVVNYQGINQVKKINTCSPKPLVFTGLLCK